MPPEVIKDLPPLDAIRHVHMIAVAGTGMGTLACMLKQAGFHVTGTDVAAYPPMSEQLAAAGIEVTKGYAPEHALDPRPDLVVIGNAVRPDNAEARGVIDAGVPYTSFPDAVRHFFIRGKQSLVVTGTHGKTTTTSMVAWILTDAGLDPGVLIGGVAENLGTSFQLGAGAFFVVEGDEYDTAFFDKTPKFLHYGARSVLLTSCEFDHADIYESLDQIRRSFAALIEAVPEDGCVVACADSDVVRELAAAASARVETYGFHESADWKVSDVAFDPSGTQFTIWRDGERVGRVRMDLFGRHNVENALGAIALCHLHGVPIEAAANALSGFRGVRRRQEVRGEASGMCVIDDFAHHPTAVGGTIEAVRARFPGHRIWAVFEPRTNTSRRRFFEDAYVEALGSADAVVIADVHRADQIPDEERFRPDEVVARLVAAGREAWHLPGPHEIVEHLCRHRSGRDVALIMSNGDFGGIWELLLARLRRLEGD